MPRPSRNLTRISVYLPADALNGLDAKAAQIAGTRSDVIRLAVESYLRQQHPNRVSQINALLGVDLWDVRSFRADVRIDFDEFGGVYGCELLNAEKPAPTHRSG
jgi:hypothetical protein